MHPARTDAKTATASLRNADRILVKNNFDRDNVSYMAVKVFRSIFSRLLEMRLVIANSYPTRTHGIIVNYITEILYALSMVGRYA